MSNRIRTVLLVWISACLIVSAVASQAHFLLNLNVRVFHVEHTSDGLRIFLRIPMPYLVADKTGEPGEDGLPSAAPFTTNAFEDGRVVHFVDPAAIATDPLGLGRIAETSTVVKAEGTRVPGAVESVSIHRMGNEPGFATLNEAKQAVSTGSTLQNDPLVYVGDAVVDITLFYEFGHSPASYALSSLLDPGLPDQDMTANLILDYGPGDPLVFRTRGLMNDPVEVSHSRLAGIATFVWEGVRHILEGIDHVLFVVCLVIGAHGLHALLWRVTGFTVGHSVTLSLGFFGYVPSGAWFVPFVETGIALSIIYAAFLAIIGGSTGASSNRKIFIVTVLMGLLHGLGFSFVLHEILQVTSPNIWQSLLAFNVGVEVGQLAIVLVTWPIMTYFTRLGPTPEMSLRVSLALGCAAISSWWTFERGRTFLEML
ncbi:HupE/UreJ family protein [Ruegeria sp. Ofav3-42]|uniref:HupE/UreJ family protein n=1 Tax=Ruegeria sp. Ofav3-42 TaxID=2917759 RepID=UPI001EF48A30|nr:HupE/UreJ family protein [Ruegeria sp. Ofav3-42]MCG7521788.1 HupE/UreJ family protein [Ruegeria sp. Ofav3-42]